VKPFVKQATWFRRNESDAEEKYCPSQSWSHEQNPGHLQLPHAPGGKNELAWQLPQVWDASRPSEVKWVL
jgi:hypothetical protein